MNIQVRAHDISCCSLTKQLLKLNLQSSLILKTFLLGCGSFAWILVWGSRSIHQVNLRRWAQESLPTWDAVWFSPGSAHGQLTGIWRSGTGKDDWISKTCLQRNKSDQEGQTSLLEVWVLKVFFLAVWATRAQLQDLSLNKGKWYLCAHCCAENSFNQISMEAPLLVYWLV